MSRQHTSDYVRFIIEHGPEEARPVVESVDGTKLQDPGQLLPGTDYSEWATSNEVFFTSQQAVEAFLNFWPKKKMQAIAGRGGHLRIKVSLEWVPPSKSSST